MDIVEEKLRAMLHNKKVDKEKLKLEAEKIVIKLNKEEQPDE